MTSAPSEPVPDREAARREAYYIATPEKREDGEYDYTNPDLLNLARAYLAVSQQLAENRDLLKRIEHLARNVPVFSGLLPAIRERIK